ncbi:hypothetical protein U9M48_012402 [Paspalum notatum var. saurae]|uniref:Chromatin assembly factor 1 subunit A dimerization domain-containing protein n=1 Tax=Paspalum notatum var. saurae TaxID=547442 RepID=A0AAQ3SZ92_PASNO
MSVFSAARISTRSRGRRCLCHLRPLRSCLSSFRRSDVGRREVSGRNRKGDSKSSSGNRASCAELVSLDFWQPQEGIGFLAFLGFIYFPFLNAWIGEFSGFLMDGDEAKESGPDGASGAASPVCPGASCEDGSAEPAKRPHKRMRRSAELDAVDKESASAECQVETDALYECYRVVSGQQLNPEELASASYDSDQELKHMKGKAEREAKRIERESKRLKKHQEEAVKAKKRKEKEEAELKRQADIQRQSKFMERLFKRKPDSNTESSASHHLEKTTCSKSSGNIEEHAVATTSAMDCTMSQPNHLRVEEFWEGHVARWTKLSKHSKFHHWGVRRSPKVQLFPDLKLRRSSAPAPFDNMLTQTKEQSSQEDSGSFDFTKLLDERKTQSIESNILSKTAWNIKSSPALLVMKLLQFDGSSRPAYYGTWRKKSSTVSARKPFQSDPELNYGVESDEEDDPGQRLSDFDEDDEKDMNEHESTEEEIENDVVVPNDYLSEDEIMRYEHLYGKFDETCSVLTAPLDIVEEPDVLLQREKFLHSATERQKPLLISNLDHRKLDLLKMSLKF